jgi:hypothetical protein
MGDSCEVGLQQGCSLLTTYFPTMVPVSQEDTTDNGTDEVFVTQFSNTVQKNFGFIENTTSFITDELELNPERTMQSTGKFDTLLSLSKCIRTLHATLNFFGI